MRLLPLLIWVLAAAPVAAQTLASRDSGAPAARGTARQIRVIRGLQLTTGSPTLDGRLDEAAWAGAEVAGEFVQMRPEPDSVETERTEARVLYDADAIYVGMRMYDRQADQIASQLGRRDATGINSDWAHVLIDSYFDRRTAFRFSVSPRGVLKDVMHFEDSNEDVNWDAVWQAATSRDSLGWTAEIRIPLSQLRFSGQGEDPRVWGINFGREIARRGEWAWWSPVLPSRGGMVSQSGELHGIEGIRPKRRLEFLPYSVARVTRAPGDAANPFYQRNDGRLALGADLKYGVTSNLTLSATLNPDFGQVEADPSVVNLSAFETFFPERRPFFIEGANIFSFGVGFDDNSGEGLFYSRRLGRSPQRFVSANGGWVNRPEATTILGAAKLSGKTASGWTVGFLDAVTDAEHARLAAPDGSFRSEPIEPRTNYAVASLSRDFREGDSTVGLLGTATNRWLGEGGEFSFLRSSAYSGGITGRHRFANDTWQANAYVAGSHVRGSTTALRAVQLGANHYFQRPDADHLEYDSTATSMTGAAANLWVSKIGGGNWRGGIGGHVRTPGFEINDLGFQGDNDIGLLFANLRYHQFQPKGIFRSWSLGLNPSAGWTTGGENTWTQLGHFANGELKNFWRGGWWIGPRFIDMLDVSTLRGGPALRRPGGVNASVFVSTDQRKRVTGSFNVWGGRERDTDRWNAGVSTGASFRPSAQFNLSVNPSLSRLSNTWQYVAQPLAEGQPQYVLGHLNQTTFSVTTRLNYTISPTLSFQLYAQPFVSAGDYENFLQVNDPRAKRFADRFLPLSDQLRFDPAANGYDVDRDGDGASEFRFRNPDFNIKQLRSNAVLRWEYRPGSTVFVVWSQGRQEFAPDGDFGLGRDMGRLFGPDLQGTNTLLVKFNYWFSL